MSTREPTARPKSLMSMGNMLLDQLQSGQKRVEIPCNKEHPEETALKQRAKERQRRRSEIEETHKDQGRASNTLVTNAAQSSENEERDAEEENAYGDDNEGRVDNSEWDLNTASIEQAYDNESSDYYMWNGEWYKWDDSTWNEEWKKARPQKRQKREPVVNSRVRNWLLAMRRNMKPEVTAAALRPFTITRDRMNEVNNYVI